jgi:hypothetical protein
MRTLFALRRSVAFAIALALGQILGAQQASKSPDSCVGLHAVIGAQLTQYDEPGVNVAFLLLNDSESERPTATESWRLVIDGKELEDSGFLFGNGGMPSGVGYGRLASGATFHFGKVLPIARYFPEQREYRISWRGRYFQSPTVTIRIPNGKN